MTPEDFTDAAFRRALEYDCEQLTAEAYRRGRSEALEEAARVAEELGQRYGWQMSDTPHKRIAAAIRALASSSTTEPPST